MPLSVRLSVRLSTLCLVQAIELHASTIACIGGIAEPASYPLSKKKHSPEFLRDLLHLRPRTNLIGAGASCVMRHVSSVVLTG